MIGNLCHGALYIVLGGAIINGIQLMGAVMQASFSGASASCVPSWSFASVFQPLITLITIVHSFGGSNLAIERDIDQDIVEMNIRLTYSDSHVPNWLLQQMICLERLDGRAFSLPANVIPSIELSRSMVSNVLAGCLFLGPYLASISDKLTSELICTEYQNP